ncbi:hypothetical protein C0Q70_01415 [Pomacea canaliculata]|uniref:3-beta hydroxysteroid dehydrogenase/isomerase domain-containing protein n=1 Tax=Pomacea canaliculata TaxID=400727 RepID=A0A2T7PZE7_POMCA|nr:hypothetical protein C0Q70_01415 [Pomacea canaliculata]
MGVRHSAPYPPDCMPSPEISWCPRTTSAAVLWTRGHGDLLTQATHNRFLRLITESGMAVTVIYCDLNKKLIEEVNIGGTENVLRACLQCNVTRLVYTSTYNVVFCGQEIRDGDESLPYVTDDKFVDHYSKTKTQADKRILAADGTLTTNGSVLRCCVLRLAGVYGPGEQRHFPRIVSYLEQGLVQFTYGARDALADFLHIDNLVLGHMLAASGLTQEKEFIAAGQAYFLSDSKPVNSFEFFRPLIEGLGYKYPRINLPLGLIFYFALLTEMVHWLVRRFYNFQPILTRAEVYKTGVTHYFSTQKAKRELGYVPIVQNDVSESG